MSWLPTVTVANLRAIKGNTDNTKDAQLQPYVNAIVADIEYLTGLKFDFVPTPQTRIFRYTKESQHFVLAGNIVQIGAWQSVTLVERSRIAQTPVWYTLIENQDFTFERHKTHGTPPITGLYILCRRIEHLEQIRITGIEGYAATIPGDLLYIIAEMLDAYYNRLIAGTGAYDIIEEQSLTRKIRTESNGLTSIKIYTPARINEFLEIIKKYNVFTKYPF